MTKTSLGSGLIIVGLAYGSFAWDRVNRATLGWLLEHGWIKPPKPSKNPGLFGPKLSIISISLGLILVGIYVIIGQKYE